jgi:hypothetical protein
MGGLILKDFRLMKLEKVITLANEPVRLRFLAMERSLRATGCDLPLWVIPYDERRFELPANAIWWTTGIRDWLRLEGAHPMMQKYQCLSTASYQYVDSDVIFLKDPAKALAREEGFITSCGHWHNPGETMNSHSLPFLKAKSTCWQRNVFNAGQFACDRALYTDEELKRTCHDPRYVETCLRFPYHDQPGVVLLANLSGAPIRNLTLPPTCMESTWAGDYATENYEEHWRNETRKPYLIHWAGCDMWEPRAIDRLFTQYLNETELRAWNEEVAASTRRAIQARHSVRQRLRNVVNGLKAFAREVRK